MAKRISELPEALLPPNPDSLIEVATPNDDSPTGYVSESIPISALGNSTTGNITARIPVNGVATYNVEYRQWQFNIHFNQIREALGLGDYIFDIGAALLDFSISVKVYAGQPYYGNTKASIFYTPNDYSYGMFNSSEGISSGGLSMLPLYPSEPYYSRNYSPFIGSVYNVNVNPDEDYYLVVSCGIVYDYDSEDDIPPSSVVYNGYVDISLMEYEVGS